MKVTILKGYVSIHKRLHGQADGPVDLPKDVATELIKAGTAIRYVVAEEPEPAEAPEAAQEAEGAKAEEPESTDAELPKPDTASLRKRRK
ncbi:hypothetical protein [Acidaminococcus intestini]